MGWVSNWFYQRTEIDRLNKEVDFQERKITELSNLLDREEKRNAVMWADLQKEFGDHKKTLRRVADAASKQLGLPQHYSRDAEPPRSAPPPPGLDDSTEAFVLWQAQEQMQADIDAGITPMELESYVKILRENPNGYVVG